MNNKQSSARTAPLPVRNTALDKAHCLTDDNRTTKASVYPHPLDLRFFCVRNGQSRRFNGGLIGGNKTPSGNTASHLAMVVEARRPQSNALDNILSVSNTEPTITCSGHPHPLAMRFFCACMKGIRQFNGGSREPNTTPSGNKFRRLQAVVEARHPTKVANNETKLVGVSHD